MRPRFHRPRRPNQHLLAPCVAWITVITVTVTAPGTAPAQQYGPKHVDFAREDWDAGFFEPGATYDASIPTPATVLGFPIGRRPVRYDEMRRYFETLAATSNRVVLRQHGATHEGRELIHAIFATPDRLARIDETRAVLRRFADPRLSGADAVPEDLPLVAWFGYSIHGDELSGCDAAVQAAYQLAAGTDARTRDILAQAIIIIDPLQNPDGRERYLAQMQAANGRIPNTDDQSLQHRGFWPWGRTNHYLFDLNRDWFTLVHPESQGRVSAMSSWNPQLVVDAHEMGWDETFLFSPPREPFNPHLPPTMRHWWDVFARDQAVAFDQAGWSFYTREWNEEFFPGYGSAWAMYSGAIGILYEQASTDGSVVRQSDGSYLTFREAVLHQYRSTLANLDTAVRHRNAIWRDYRLTRQRGIEQGARGPMRLVAFAPGNDAARTLHLVRSLAAQGIEIERAVGPIELARATDYWGHQHTRLALPAGSYVVRMSQPHYALLRNLLDVHIAMPDSFLREERDYLERDKESRLYDVTAWNLPLSYGVDAYWSDATPNGALAPFEAGQTVAPPASLPESVDYGYAIDGASDSAMHAVAKMLERELNVRIALEPVAVAGQRLARGSILLRQSTNPSPLARTLEEIASATGVHVMPLQTGRADVGPDLGGGRFPALVRPRVALVTGPPVSSTSYGALWHLLDHDLGVRVSSLEAQSIADLELDKYNVIVLPDAASATQYARALGPDAVAALRQWVKTGGTMVAIGAGAALAADSSQALSAVRLRQSVLKEHASLMAREPLPESARMLALGDAPGARSTPAMPLLGKAARRFVEHVRSGGGVGTDGRKPASARPTAVPLKDIPLADLERADARLRRFHPQGALVRLDVDLDHWLTSGIAARAAGLVRSDRALIARAPVRVLARYAPTEELHLSGLLWPEAADRLARTAYLTQESIGNGQIILFAEDPTFRRSTRGLERLLLNALLLGPGLGTTRSAPW